MEVSTIKDRFYTIVGESSASPIYFTATLFNEWFKGVIREMASECRHIESREVQASVADQATYNLPAECKDVLRVTYDSEKLIPIRPQGLRRVDEEYKTRTGGPIYYYLDELNQKVGLAPVPSTGAEYASEASTPGYGTIVDTGASGTPSYGIAVDLSYGAPIDGGAQYGGMVDILVGNGIEVFYRHDGTTTTDDDHEPPVPGWAWPVILYGVLQRAFGADTVRHDKKQAAFWGALFEHGKRRLKIRANQKLPKSFARKQWLSGYMVDSFDDIRRRWPETVG